MLVRYLRQGWIIALLALGVAACETPGAGPVVSAPVYEPVARPEGPLVAPAPRREYSESEFLTPPHMDGKRPVRVGLLLPFSSENEGVRKVAGALFDAAQLAIFDAGDANLLLIPKDTKGTPEGARRAAEGALQEGAEIVLGPLLADSVAAASELTKAAERPMIAFSSDMTVAGGGVFTLSFPPELEIARVTDYAMVNGYNTFGLLAPMNDYGRRVSEAFAEEVFVRGGALVAEESYEQRPEAMVEPAKRLAQYNKRRANLSAEREALAILDTEPVAERALEALENRETFGNLPYEAVLIPEQGNMLRALAPLLPYYDVDIRTVKLLGTSLWNNPALAREPALSGGWFAAPDPEASAAFRQRYRTVYGYEAPRLASLSYDATTLAARLARRPERGRFDLIELVDPNGFLGVDGAFRFTADGGIERALAILELRSSGIRVVEPAPRSFMDFTGF